jgi:hypothetical protein
MHEDRFTADPDVVAPGRGQPILEPGPRIDRDRRRRVGTVEPVELVVQKRLYAEGVIGVARLAEIPSRNRRRRRLPHAWFPLVLHLHAHQDVAVLHPGSAAGVVGREIEGKRELLCSGDVVGVAFTTRTGKEGEMKP